jgi:uncharacterized protein Usg
MKKPNFFTLCHSHFPDINAFLDFMLTLGGPLKSVKLRFHSINIMIAWM